MPQEATVYAGHGTKAYTDMLMHIIILPQYASTWDDTQMMGEERRIWSRVLP